MDFPLPGGEVADPFLFDIDRNNALISTSSELSEAVDWYMSRLESEGWDVSVESSSGEDADFIFRAQKDQRTLTVMVYDYGYNFVEFEINIR